MIFKMKILFTIGNLKKGGAERVIANLSNSFIENHEIILVLTTAEEIEYKLNDKIKLYRLDKINQNNNFIIKNINRVIGLKKIVKEEQPNIMISFLPEPSYRLLLVKPKNIPAIVSVRNDPNEEYNNFIKRTIMKLLYAKANGFVFQTPQAKSYFSNKIQQKSTIIANPIKEDFICKRYEGKREKTIVTVGRLTEQKNQKLLIDAFNYLNKKYDDYTLKIYGEGNLENELKKYTQSLEKKDKIIFMGTVNDVKKEIYKSSLFVLSSNYEGMPNSLMEAMAMGIPCISANCKSGGPDYLFNNEKNGILFEVNNKEDLTKKIEKILSNSKIAEKIGKNGNEYAKNFEIKKITLQWEKFIKRIIKEGK